MTLPLHLAPEVREASQSGRPLVVLESTVISHGLPYPDNLETAQACESAVRAAGATPATVGILSGRIHVGLDADQIEVLATSRAVRKVSRRDFPIVMARGEHGATTVAGTLIVAAQAGIPVFATGGIGGVHRGDSGDVSADLPELARSPVMVVCAGAKSILDLPRTLETLETLGVPVLGYQTDHFPAFYTASSGLSIDARVESPAEAAAILRAARQGGVVQGLLLAVPAPAELAIPASELQAAIEAALAQAESQRITGKAITPFLLAQVAELTQGRSRVVNKALLRQNAQLAGEIAVAFARGQGVSSP